MKYYADCYHDTYKVVISDDHVRFNGFSHLLERPQEGLTTPIMDQGYE
jgi:uncharacterized protein YpmS